MKKPDIMSAGEINKELDRLDKARSLLNGELIAAGRGHETMQDTLKLKDPLALRAYGIWDRQCDLRNEIARRYGPGAPSRLPSGRGFGPIKPY